MKTARLLLLLTLVLLTTTNIFAQQKVDAIDVLLKQYSEFGQLNGAVLVADEGKIIYEKGFGMANMEWAIPNQPDTRFRIGSVTKQFTAALILQLVEEGKIKLDGKLTDYLPDYRKDTGDKVTIHQLLNHTSGIPSYTGRPDFEKEIMRNPFSVADLVKKYSSGDFDFEPGARFSYNNSGYIILGAIIEQITGKSYETVLTERILKPLGMTGTGYDNTAPLLQKRASGYQKRPAGYINAAYLDMSLPYAAGSMYSTVDDLYKWDQSLYEDKILSAESKKLMFTPGQANYGYGIRIVDMPLGKSQLKVKTIGHGGGINGFNSLITRAIEKRQTVIILDNVSQGQFHGQITNSVLSILNGQPFDPPKRSVGETLYKLTMNQNVSAAIAEYRKLKTANDPTYDFAEAELKSLGGQLTTAKRAKDALEIFKLNAEMFPKSTDAFDALGEAYLADNQKDLALASYKKAFELEPANVAALQMVRQLEGKETKVDASGFAAYVGEYPVTPTFILTITKEGDKLFGRGSGPSNELKAVSETQFVIPQVKASITFEKDAAGQVTGLTLYQNTRIAKVKKVK